MTERKGTNKWPSLRKGNIFSVRFKTGGFGHHWCPCCWATFWVYTWFKSWFNFFSMLFCYHCVYSVTTLSQIIDDNYPQLFSLCHLTLRLFKSLVSSLSSSGHLCVTHYFGVLVPLEPPPWKLWHEFDLKIKKQHAIFKYIFFFALLNSG